MLVGHCFCKMCPLTFVCIHFESLPWLPMSPCCACLGPLFSLVIILLHNRLAGCQVEGASIPTNAPCWLLLSQVASNKTLRGKILELRDEAYALCI